MRDMILHTYRPGGLLRPAIAAALSAALLLATLQADAQRGARRGSPTQRAAASIYHDGWIDFDKDGVKDVYEDPSAPLERRVEDLLSLMTVEEKTCQLVTLYGFGRVLRDSLPTPAWMDRVWKDGVANIDEMLNGVGPGLGRAPWLIYPFGAHVEALHEVQRFFVEKTRLGIPVEFSNEGIHGLNHYGATPLPAPIGIGCTWDRDLVRRAGTLVGDEAELLGYHSVYAPILDLARDPRWGRTVETYGEDPYLVAELGTAMASGIQRRGVSAGLKHFAAYSVPAGGRDGHCRTDPQVTPRELHQVLLRPFAQVVRRAHPQVVMASYNDYDGTPVIASRHMLTELLRDGYGFDGYVVSDSQAVEFTYEKHQVVHGMEEAAAVCLEAGLDVRTNFWEPETFVEPLRSAIAKGMVSMDVVDERVREVLRFKFRRGLFDNPYTGDAARADAEAGYRLHEDLTRELAAKSMVLLKNKDSLLPLDKRSPALRRILVTGPMAEATDYATSRYGPCGIDPVTVLEGLRSHLEGSGVEVVYEKGCEVRDRLWPESEVIPEPLTDGERDSIGRAVDAARGCDVVVAVMGEDTRMVGENFSRTSLDLPGRQRDLLMALHATGKPVVLVLVNGRPLTINWENTHLEAILEAWYPNYLSGKIVAETLFGDINPSGRLSTTFPRSVGQIPYAFPFHKGARGGQDVNPVTGGGVSRVTGALYPFGYGLGYTTFDYSGMSVRPTGDESFDVSCSVRNTGPRAGEDVVQLYIRDLVSSAVAYDSVLRGFERVSLQPGEEKTVVFNVGPEELEMLGPDMRWRVEPGFYEVRIGASSEDIRLRRMLHIPFQEEVTDL